jgi:hypothetical protein
MSCPELQLSFDTPVATPIHGSFQHPQQASITENHMGATGLTCPNGWKRAMLDPRFEFTPASRRAETHCVPSSPNTNLTLSQAAGFGLIAPPSLGGLSW